VVELGVGPPIDPYGLEADALAATVTRVLDDAGFRSHARRLQRQFLALPGLDRLVSDLEALTL
jgi:UDP:flavonoid glycosyltransferase YjiC (YdhE family)